MSPSALFCRACGEGVTAPGSPNPTPFAQSPYVGHIAGQSSTSLPLAGFGHRLLAYILDVLILLIPCAIVGAIFFPLSFVVSWLYFALFEAGEWQATPGKRVLGLRVVDLGYRPLTFGQTSARHVCAAVSWLLFGIGFLVIIGSAKKQALHDMMANTLVVQVPAGYVRT
jgi:uncharacterized RDD family membrane protein YckC